MEPKDNLLSILQLLYRFRKKLIYLALVTFVVAAAITLMIPNYYKASTVFYPTSEDMTKPEAIFGGSDREIRFYGSDIELDRLIAMSQSPELLNHLVEEFDLTDRYGIPEGSKNWRSRLHNRLHKLYNVKKTQYDGVELSIEDTDPEVAAEMVISAREKISEIATDILKSAQNRMIQSLESNIAQNEILLHEIRDSLRTLRQRYGIYSVETQAEEYSSLLTQLESKLQKERTRYQKLSENSRIPRDTLAYFEANLMGMEEQYNYLTGEEGDEFTGLRRFNQGMGGIRILESRFTRENNQLSFDRIRLKNFQAAYETPYSAVFVLQEAFPPDEKSRPKRSLIVIGAMFFVLFFAVLGILIFNSIDQKTLERIKTGEQH